MPELPEVEVSRQGLLPYLPGQRIVSAIFRVPKLRDELPVSLALRLTGLRVEMILRRGKYLLFDCESARGGGWLILHLGMSGRVRLVAPGTSVEKHDHVDLVFPRTILRYHDARRFGALLWHEGSDIALHPRIAVLGVEPLTPEFNAAWLHAQLRLRRGPIKPLLMDSHLLVGVGNIYAAESLFLAGISPLRAACQISLRRCRVLVLAIQQTLNNAIAAGGSSIRDYANSDGEMGFFQISCAVYGRQDQPCLTCGSPIRLIRQAGRSTFYCEHCQS